METKYFDLKIVKKRDLTMDLQTEKELVEVVSAFYSYYEEAGNLFCKLDPLEHLRGYVEGEILQLTILHKILSGLDAVYEALLMDESFIEDFKLYLAENKVSLRII